MPTRTPRIPDAVLAKVSGKTQYRMATAGAAVVIGGDHPTLVLPEARAEKWGGECWLRVRHADADEIDRADRVAKAGGKALKAVEKASLRIEKGKPVLDIPTPGKGRRHEIREGSLKWDVVYEDASALPADGIERFQLEFPAGLEWHYQPALTPEEIAEGAERPDNVVGSYAGYFDRSGRIIDANGEEIANYETGKFAHLYRPEMVDAAGDRCWAVQELVGNELRVTLPAEWMATAVYPVRLDPTFGYTSNGGSSYALYSTRTVTAKVTAPTSAGTCSKITAWLSYFNLSGGSKGTAGIYTVGTDPDDLLTNGVTAETVSDRNPGATPTEFDFNFSAGPSVATDGSYALALASTDNDGSLSGYMKYDSTGGDGMWYATTTYSSGTLPNPYPAASTADSDGRASIYATYTESGGGGSYTETLDTLITSISIAADRQTYRETVDTLITSGATVDAVTGMVEALLTLGQSASTAADVQGYADGVSDTIISASDTADAQDYVDGPATTGVSSSDETDTQAYTDSLADTLVSASDVTDTTGTPPLAESLLTTAVSASHASAAQAYVDTVTALAVSASSLGEVLGMLEQIGTVGESISAVSDRQLYYDNVAIVALSSSSLAEVGAYVEQVGVAAVSASSLTDVLVGSFVGRYVFADYCRPRSFADFARPRSFVDYCRPRGRRLQ